MEPGRPDTPRTAARPYTTKEWSAWCDTMPPGPPRLHVRGKVEFTTGGYKAELVRAEPQGINPAILLLDLMITAPTDDVVTQPIDVQEVCYDEEADGCYQQVQIRPDDITLDVEVAS